MKAQATYDVLVAGAGPAGAHTALRLARLGWNVALIDRRTFPRAKPCGEFLSPACLPLLEELGLLDELYEMGALRVRGMHLHAGDQRASGDYVAIGKYVPPAMGPGHGLGLRREVLDELAVRAAERHPRIRAMLGWRVLRPLQDSAGRVCGLVAASPEGEVLELSSRFVVGADGALSKVAGSLGWSAKWSGQERFALVARFRGVEESYHAEVHILEGGDYFAACPIDDGIFTVNLVVDRESLPKGSHNLEVFFRERVKQAPALEKRLAGSRTLEEISVCGPLRQVRRRCTAPGVALVGDACGFVDPLTGEGLFLAMQGAKLLAERLDRALKDPTREARELRSYVWARQRDLSPRYGLARGLQRGLRNARLPKRIIGVLGRNPHLCQLVLGLTGDYVPTWALLSPAMWWNLILSRSSRKSSKPRSHPHLARG